MIQRTIRGPPNAQTGSTSNRLTPKAPYKAWLAKLRADEREAKAQIAVLIAVHPPAEVETFLEREGVWVVQRRYAKVLAVVLRKILIEIYAKRTNQAGKDKKMEVLYQNLTSVEFQHRIQAIVEQNLSSKSGTKGAVWRSPCLKDYADSVSPSSRTRPSKNP